MAGRCHSNPLISRAGGLWFSVHIWSLWRQHWPWANRSAR